MINILFTGIPVALRCFAAQVARLLRNTFTLTAATPVLALLFRLDPDRERAPGRSDCTS
ncbi:hypothetical protein ACFVGY_05380 [Streptomyces sp. NPDC127106]|uniref:hypothetical protein n=1 Tax=Streptomyces sp. NPDC127106 TaxID=3345360 RepID=UPI003638F81E